jgi:glycosyltransferase involved in cell wall biosynthesis
MRILVCTNAYAPRFVGGAELVAHQIARQMVRLGHDVAVFAGNLDDSRDHHTMMSDTFDGVQVHRVTTHSANYDHRAINYVHCAVDTHFATILREFQPAVVHAHNLVGLSVRLLIAAAESGARVFVTLHDFWGFCLRNTLILENGMPCQDRTACAGCLGDTPEADWALRVRRDMMALAFDHVTGFVAPGRYLADAYLAAGFPPDRMNVVPNGIDVAPFAEAQSRHRAEGKGMVILLYAGHFGAHKGLQVLMRALSLMRWRDRVRLDLVGDGAEATRLRALVQRLGLAEQVRFRGKIQPAAMPDVYAACDVFVLPSIWPENQPVCLMEAMACARPVVASRIGGIPDMIDNDVEGVLIAPNDPQALADALDRLVAAPDLRVRMGQSGRARVQNHGYDHQALALLDLFARNQPDDCGLTETKPIVALLGEQAWRGDEVEPAVQRALAHETGYAVPYAWLTALQRNRIAAFMLVRPNSGKGRLLQRLFGPRQDLIKGPQWLVWLGRALLLRHTREA